MVNVTTSDVLTEDLIRRVIEEERDFPLIWNEMFRNIPMEGNGPTFHIPLDEGLMSEPDRVNEGSEFPRTEEDYETIPVTVEKHGFEVAITRESQAFSIFDVVAQQMEKAARRFNEYINRQAFEEVDANLHPNSPKTSDDFDFELATQAKKELQDERLSPQVMVVNTAGEKELLNSENFQRASDLGDDITREAAIGRFAGVDVMVDTAGYMPTDDPVGYLADPDEYGYEVVSNDVSMDDYEAPEKQSDIIQLWTERAWKAVHNEAIIKLEA